MQQASDLSRLLNAKPLGGKAVKKIALDSRDGAEFDRLVLNQADGDSNEFENKHLLVAFEIIRQWIEDNTLEQIGSFLYKLQNHALVIRLDVSDAKDAFKLFETINNRGLKLSPTDIIKNFVLGNAARFGTAELNVARNSWAKLITHLDGTDTDAFFRYFLIASLNKRVTRSKVVPEFKTLFMNDVVEAASLPDRHLYAYEEEEEEADDLAEPAEGDDIPLKRAGNAKVSFKAFLNRVVVNARAFGQLVLAKTGEIRIDRHLRNLQNDQSGSDLWVPDVPSCRRDRGETIRHSSEAHGRFHPAPACLQGTHQRNGSFIRKTLLGRPQERRRANKEELPRRLPDRREVQGRFCGHGFRCQY